MFMVSKSTNQKNILRCLLAAKLLSSARATFACTAFASIAAFISSLTSQVIVQSGSRKMMELENDSTGELRIWKMTALEKDDTKVLPMLDHVFIFKTIGIMMIFIGGRNRQK